MKLKIVSDGTPMGTRVENAETGELLEDVVAVAWHIQVSGIPTLAVATVTLVNIPLDAVGELFQGLKRDG